MATSLNPWIVSKPAPSRTAVGWLFLIVLGLVLWTAAGVGCRPSAEADRSTPSRGTPGDTEPMSPRADAGARSRGLDIDEGDPPATGGKYRAQWAIIVGINHYQDERWPTLQCATQDAREVRDMLRDEFGFAPERTRYLEDGQATYAAISDALAVWLPKSVEQDDAVLFYFAGHGLQSGAPQDKEGYLVPCDAHGAPPGERYLAVPWLVGQLQSLKCRHKAVILDSCYSGALFRKVRTAEMSETGHGPRSGWDYYFSQPTFLGLTAAHNTPVDDGAVTVGHSPFTMALLDVLRDRADLPSQPAEISRSIGGRWPRGTFGFTSLAGRVAERVQQTAQQTPKWGALAGSEGDGDFLFCPTVPRLTPSEKHERRQYAATIREACEKLSSNVDEADSLLAALPGSLRGWEWRYLANCCRLNEIDRRVCKQRITGISFSADGRTLAACAEGGQTDLWDAAGRRRDGPDLAALKTHGLALDATGRRLAVAFDETIAIVDLESDQRHVLCDDMTWGDSAQMVVSGDGHVLAALSNDGVLRTWNLDSGRSFDPLPKIGVASAIVLSHDGQLLAAAVGSQVILWHLADGQRKTLEADGPGKICCLAFDPTGQRLLAVDRQAAIFGWRLPEATPEPVRRHELEQVPIAQAALSRDLGYVAFARDDRQIEIRRVNDARATGTVTRLPGHGAAVTRLAFSADGQKLVSGDSHGLLKIWNTRPASTDFTYSKHTAGINDLAINSRQLIASADDQGEIHLWRWDPLANQLHPERILRANSQEVLAVDFNSQGDELASGGRDGLIRIWNVETGAQLAERGPSDPGDVVPPSISALAFDPAGQRVVAGYSDKNVRIWDVTRRQELSAVRPEFVFGDSGKTPRFHQHGLRGVAFFSQGTAVFSAAERTDNRTRKPTSAEWIAWQANDGQVQFRFDTEQDGERYGVVCQQRHAHAGRVAASRDGRWLAAAGPDQFFTLWDAQSGRLMVQAAPENAAGGRHVATAVAFSPDGERLAVTSTDGVVRIWDVTGESLLLEFDTLPGPAFAVAFSPDGSLLAAASATIVRVFAAPEPGESEAPAAAP